MTEYLVVWRHTADVIQSKVDIKDDPHLLSPNQWVTFAAKSEGYSEEDVETILDYGYDLFLVCDMPVQFYDSY